eukprot:TRINITY_DN15992_c0_g1_i2.p1 TRINITY_DN15992_c0_g1~~TRINITY_DN15992_c0_g1_i2.p1  ORF type:complete len:413 (-),score=34.01 TRINITY_DN15992_c0_g1_i2:82-1263(-)
MDCFTQMCMPGKSDNFATEHKQYSKQSRCQQVADFLDPSYLFYDEPFSLRDWDKHQRWRRHCPKGLICIRAAWGMKGPLIYLTLLSVVVGIYHEFLPKHGWPYLSEDVPMTLIITATSFALALLMIFRTNSSYGRWWEARMAWGAIYTQCRVLSRLTKCYIKQPQDQQAAESIISWAVALPYLVLYHLSVESEEVECLRDDMEPILKVKEVCWLIEQPHKPLAGCSAISYAVSKVDMHPIIKAGFENQLVAYSGSFGACERILKQPIPQAYTRHTSRFLMLWLTVLPFALWPALKWACLLFCPLISFVLLGIENIGVQIEQPFHVLPLRQFCKVIQRNVLDVVSGIQSFEQLQNTENMDIKISNSNILLQDGQNPQKEFIVENSISKSADNMV